MFVEVCISLSELRRLLNILRLIHSLDQAVLFWCAYFNDFLRRNTSFGPECESKYIFMRIDEGEGRVFLIFHDLYFEYFSFEVDDPAHLIFLSLVCLMSTFLWWLLHKFYASSNEERSTFEGGGVLADGVRDATQANLP